MGDGDRPPGEVLPVEPAGRSRNDERSACRLVAVAEEGGAGWADRTVANFPWVLRPREPVDMLLPLAGSEVGAVVVCDGGGGLGGISYNNSTKKHKRAHSHKDQVAYKINSLIEND